MPMPGQQAQQSLPEYDLARKRAQQRVTASGQEQQDALKRRFAALGGLNSGAYIKQQQLAQDRQQEQLQDANEGIDVQENAERRRLQELKEGREFQAGEAQKQREFASAESRLGREFASGESALGRRFAAEQAHLGREFDAGQSEKQRQWAKTEAHDQRMFQKQLTEQDLEFKNKVFNAENAARIDQFNLALKQFEMDKDTTEFNKWLAREELNRPDGLIRSIGGQGGLFGLYGSRKGGGWAGKVFDPGGLF